ncbi:MAG: enoyl-CoA hydratase/isomerase family protein [Rhizobiaceae bacterium]|nr:enoyl-CoA hydratase/isomerase family protein [Rhizobiaceae bacterium]
MFERYSHYTRLKFDMPAPRVLRVALNTDTPLNLMDSALHREVGEIWRDIEADESVSAVILTGNDKAFSAGGDLRRHSAVPSFEERMAMMKEAHNIVYNMINFPKPIVTAIRGWAVGAGLACALLGDITIAAKDAKLRDGHAKLGVAAGDHAAIIWPLLCGMAKAKYYLLLCETITGQEAERIGLISLAVESDELDERSIAVASRLAQSSPLAMRTIKSSMNNWLRQAGPIFDHSLALEVMSFFGPDYAEGKAAILEKREPDYYRSQAESTVS